MKQKSLLPSLILSILLAVVGGVFTTLVLESKMIPTRLLIPGMIALWLIILLVVLLLFSRRRKSFFVIGMILYVLVIAVMIVGAFGVRQAINAVGTILGTEVQRSTVLVYVNDDDPAQHLQDLEGYEFGILDEMDRENTDLALKELRKDLKTDLSVTEYSDPRSLVEALLEGDVNAVVLNEAYLDILAESEDFSDITSRLRVVSEHKVEIIVPATQPAPDKAPTAPGEKRAPFSIYLSGIDTRGGMTDKSRSDSNIIAFINPESHQVLLLSTPRDYYVPLSFNGALDKLTHSGIYGVEVSMDTLGDLYGVDLDYYFRINFVGFKDVIDALGGVTVYSDYSFTAVTGDHYDAGYNDLDGERALTFARERYAFSDGDFQRGRNQTAVIKAVIKKAMSADFLMNFNSVLTAVSDSMDTSFPYDDLAALIRIQLEENPEWNIVSYSVSGYLDFLYCYSSSGEASVVVPSDDSVAAAKELIRQVYTGETVVLP